MVPDQTIKANVTIVIKSVATLVASPSLDHGNTRICVRI
jgi:hypothetical protein